MWFSKRFFFTHGLCSFEISKSITNKHNKQNSITNKLMQLKIRPTIQTPWISVLTFMQTEIHTTKRIHKHTKHCNTCTLAAYHMYPVLDYWNRKTRREWDALSSLISYINIHTILSFVYKKKIKTNKITLCLANMHIILFSPFLPLYIHVHVFRITLYVKPRIQNTVKNRLYCSSDIE